ncbi:MAG: tetratricopeptide repeat protein [Thermoguttaceae bacterium]
MPDRNYDGWTAAMLCTALALVVMVVFGRSVFFGFVNYDDPVNILENPAIARGLSPAGLSWAITTTHGHQWAPLTWTSYLLDFEFVGLRPWGYHLTNVLLHLSTTVLLFLAFWRSTGRLWPSALAAALFGVHPLRAESVAWVSERKGLLSGFWFVASLVAYWYYVRRPGSWRRYLLLAATFALSLLAKPVAMTLPLVLLLLDYWPLGRVAGGRWSVASDRSGNSNSTSVVAACPSPATAHWPPATLLLEKIPLLALSVAAGLLATWGQGTADIGLHKLSLEARLSNGLVSYVSYLGQMVWPVGLSAFYPHPEGGLPFWRPMAALVVLLTISALAWVGRRRCPYCFVGWFWYLVMMTLAIGLVQIGSHAMADRYTYLPQIGLCVAAAWGVCDAASSASRRVQIGVAATSFLALAIFGVAAFRQTCCLHDSESLCNHALRCNAENNVARSNLGGELARQGRLDEAIVQYREAVRIRPDDAVSFSNLGNALLSLGRSDEAEQSYAAALRVDPNCAEAHCNVGVLLARRHQWDEAASHYEAALRLRPEYVDALANYGNLLARRGELDRAAACYKKAVQCRPDRPEIRRNYELIQSRRAGRP